MERQAEYRGAAHEIAILGSEKIDPRHGRGLGRMRQTVEAAGLDRDAQQVAQELRIPAGALRDGFQDVPGKGIVRSRVLRQAQRVGHWQRIELDADDCRHFGCLEARSFVTSGDPE